MIVSQGPIDAPDNQARAPAANIGDEARPTPGPPSGFVADTGPLMAPPPPAGDPPTRIVIPKIGLDSKIITVGWRVVQENGHSVSVWDVADFAAGWNRGSAFPGNVGNTVISGHHNIKGEVFRYVVDLEVGDEVDLFVATQRYPYRVTEKHILREKGMPDEVRTANARWIAQTTDQRLTLVTCWPFTNNTHRLIVVAKPMWK
jgi:sortase A